MVAELDVSEIVTLKVGPCDSSISQTVSKEGVICKLAMYH